MTFYSDPHTRVASAPKGGIALWGLDDDGYYRPIYDAPTVPTPPAPSVPTQAEIDEMIDSALAGAGAGAGGGAAQKQVELEMKKREYIINGTAEIAFPNPYLIGGRPVTLKNLGYSFSGDYEVEVAKHSIGVSGYSQELSLTRNASGITFLEAKQPAEESREPKPEVDPKADDAKHHTVSSGETLWGIAKRYYGDGSQYPKIVQANPSIDDPNLIYPGQKFIIP